MVNAEGPRLSRKMTPCGISSAYGSAATPAAKARLSLNVLVLKVLDQIYEVSPSSPRRERDCQQEGASERADGDRELGDTAI
jgi:hypothetical protein